MEMPVPIVRIKSYRNDGTEEFGSGIILSPKNILTAAHVLRGERHVIVLNDKDINACIRKKNSVAALLETETEIALEEEQTQVKFTNEELLTEDIKWHVEGFITDEQIFHEMSGTGLVTVKSSEYGTDFQLQNIEAGYAENYQGLSGAPVICRDRIVGILQIQDFMERGTLGIQLSSTKRFLELLSSENIGASKYMDDLKKRARAFTEKAIEKNISSKKYIPDIFVEAGNYKENFRYYAEPDLFLQKVIEEMQRLDLDAVNRFLTSNNEQALDFRDIAVFASINNLSDTWELLLQRLDTAIHKIEKAEVSVSKEIGLSREKQYLRDEEYSYGILHSLENLREETRFFQYKIIMITNDAGQGKTNFLCDFTRNFLLKKGFFVLFYNAYDFREPFMNLIKRELTLDENFSWKYARQVLTDKWEKEHKSLFVIIDGLNENTALNDFGGYVVDFLEEAKKLPFMKVVLSTRNELLEERFGQLNSENFGSEFYQMDMQYQLWEFKKRIFDGYLKYFDIDIMENSLLHETFVMLTKDTLLLRFFCEVNSGKRQVRMLHVYKYSLFEKYYEMKRKESIPRKSPGNEALFDKLIDHICQSMIASQQFTKMPRNELSEEELVILDKLLETDVIFKQEMQMQRGLLTETESFLSFTFDEFRDFCITRYLLKTNDETSFSELWRRMHIEKWSVLEGVERYIFFLARTENRGILPILQAEKGYPQLYWKNVWDLEEKDMTEEDISLWKEEVLSGGSYTTSIVNFLLVHTDRSYFQRINVDLLFEMLNLLAKEPITFDSVMQRLFSKTPNDIFERSTGEEAVIFSCKELKAQFQKHKKEKDFISSARERLRFSIYMVGIDAPRIEAMWAEIYPTAPEEVETIFELYVEDENLPQIIYHNIELLLEAVSKKSVENARLEELKKTLAERIQKYDYQAINEKLASIWAT